MERWTVVAVSLFALSVSASANAQVHQCGRVWTDRPCDAAASSRSSISAPPTSSAVSQGRDVREIGQRKIWFNDLDLKRIAVKDEHGISLDISQARAVCLGAEGDSLRCRAEIDRKMIEAEQRVLMSVQTKAAQQLGKATPAPLGPDLSRPTTVTIIQQRQENYLGNVVVVPRPTAVPTLSAVPGASKKRFTVGVIEEKERR